MFEKLKSIRDALTRTRQAAFGRMATLLGATEITPELWDDLIAINLKHQFFCAQAVLSDMQTAKQGVIVNFGSISWIIGQGGSGPP